MRSTASDRLGFRGIAESIQDAIVRGEIVSGQKLPTERELQEQFGVSRSTIRKALGQLVESGFGQSLPNRGVVALLGVRPTKTKSVALIDCGSYVNRVITIQLAEMLHTRGYHPIHLGGGTGYPMQSAIQRAVDGDYAGAIVWSYDGFAQLDFLEKAPYRLPLIALDHRLNGAETDLVTFDQEAAATEATEQLIRQGCRRIGVTGMLDMLEVTHQRFRGYMWAMFKNGLQPEAADYIFTATSGRDTANPVPLESRLRHADRLDGLLVLQDCNVPSTVEAALRVGLNLPRDLKIATIGDDILVDVNGAQMTAVAFDWDTMINEAFRLLMERIEDPSKPYETVVAPHKLHIRGLCGAPREEWTPEFALMRPLKDEPSVPRSRFRYSSHWSVLDDGKNSQS